MVQGEQIEKLQQPSKFAHWVSVPSIHLQEEYRNVETNKWYGSCGNDPRRGGYYMASVLKQEDAVFTTYDRAKRYVEAVVGNRYCVEHWESRNC